MRKRGMAGAMASAMAVAVLASGCGASGWRESTDPIDLDGVAWALDGVIHLPDGRTVETGGDVAWFEPAGDGVFFGLAASERGVANPTVSSEIRFARPEEDAEEIGVKGHGTGVRATPDGSALAVLEADYDDGSATMRIFDLESGDEHETDDGMRSDSDDPVSALLEAEVEIVAIDDQQVWARTVQGLWAYDVDTGRGREVGDDEEVPPSPEERDGNSPDGRWRVVSSNGSDYVIGEGDEVVKFSVPADEWELEWWASDETVVGRGREDGGESRMLVCRVGDASCEAVAETQGRVVTFALGSARPWGASYLEEAS